MHEPDKTPEDDKLEDKQKRMDEACTPLQAPLLSEPLSKLLASEPLGNLPLCDLKK